MPDLDKTLTIDKILASQSLAEEFDDEDLATIGQSVWDGYEIDELSRASWLESMEEAFELAMLVMEQKDGPFTKSSNIKYPLLATACIQFGARAYPNFVKGLDVVKGIPIGKDDEAGTKVSRAERIGEHMSYQCINEMEEWEEDTDKLLTILPIPGCVFKETYFDSGLGRNVSAFLSAKDLVINYYAKSMATAPRMTKIYSLYPNEIEEKMRGGLFLDIELDNPQSTMDNNEEPPGNDPDQPHVFLAQHTYYDFDGDGYKEPYIITIHKDTKRVVRIVRRFEIEDIKFNEAKDKIMRITGFQHFTRFIFMHSPDGSIYGWGYGKILTPINRSINTNINQLNDAGTLHNHQGGFKGKGIQFNRGRGGGVVKFTELGEWKDVGFVGDDIRKQLFPLPTHEPSSVLFNLLGFMVQAGDRLSSVSELFSGEQSNASERPTTTLARIEQGLKVFSSIHKRLFRAFREEYKKLYALNARFLEQEAYYTVLDDRKAIKIDDYKMGDCDVIPVADPNELSNTQKIMKAEMLMERLGTGLSDKEINKRWVEAMQFPDAKKLLDAPEPPPDPKVVLEQGKLDLENRKFAFEVSKHEITIDESEAKIIKMTADTIKALADAEAAEVGPQLAIYEAQMKEIMEERKMKMQERKEKQSANNGGGV